MLGAQVNMQLDLMSEFNTDGRTDGLTEKLVPADSHVTAVDARARVQDRGML